MSYSLKTTPEPGHFFTQFLHLKAEKAWMPRWLPDIVRLQLPDGSVSEVKCENLQWFVNGKPVYKAPFLKSGYMRKNLVAQSVAAALYGGVV